jgi:hypothetical protein
VGKALAQIAQNPSIAAALFEVLETQNVLASKSLQVNIVPAGTPVLYTLGAAGGRREAPPPK